MNDGSFISSVSHLSAHKPAYIDFRQALSPHASFRIATTKFANIF
jgi:hypothetical protein